jgi:hypothetical protein
MDLRKLLKINLETDLATGAATAPAMRMKLPLTPQNFRRPRRLPPKASLLVSSGF